jgi:hypothetical protein
MEKNACTHMDDHGVRCTSKDCLTLSETLPQR